MILSNKTIALGEVADLAPKLVRSLTLKGRELSSANFLGEGYLAILRLLDSEGPLTIPEIALHRGVSRQRIQKLSRTMVDNDLIELVDNPAHKSSKLLRLSKMGKQHEKALASVFYSFVEEELSKKFTLKEIELTLDVMQRLQSLLYPEDDTSK